MNKTAIEKRQLHKKPIVLTMANRKGGVGKTTNTVNLAYVLSQIGYSVLVIDDDPQGSLTQILGVNRNSVTNDPKLSIQNLAKISKELRENQGKPYPLDDLFGNAPEEETEVPPNTGLHELVYKTFYDTPISKKDIDDAIISPTYAIEETINRSTKKIQLEELMQKRVKKYRFGFDLIPSSEELTDDELMISLDNNPNRTKRKGLILLQIVQAIGYYKNYDIILIDTGPSLGIMTINALAAAQDGIIISAAVDEQSLWSLRKFKFNIRQIKRTIPHHEGILGVILGPVDPKSQMHSIISHQITSVLNLYLFKNQIPRSASAAKATASGLLFSHLEEKAYDAYERLADEIIQRQAQNHRWEVERDKKVQARIEKLKEEDTAYLEKTNSALIQVVRNEYSNGELWPMPMTEEVPGENKEL